MIKFEDTEVVGWKEAIRNLSAKGYRRTKKGRYEAFCSNRGDSIFFGTYDTVEEAKESVFNYRADRLLSRVKEYGLDINDGIVFEDNYIAFSNGMIFNLHGVKKVGHINRDGYIYGTFNGKTKGFHRIIASIFCERETGKDFVNHIDGNKANNDASNLEWVTRSENTLHAYKNGLQNNVGGIPIYTDAEK